MCRCTWERKTECWGGSNLVLRFYCAFACGHLYMSEWWMEKDKMPTNQSLHWQPACCQHHMFVDLVMSMCVQGVLQKYTKLHNRLINSPFKSNETPVNITTHIVVHKLMKVSLSLSKIKNPLFPCFCPTVLTVCLPMPPAVSLMGGNSLH